MRAVLAIAVCAVGRGRRRRARPCPRRRQRRRAAPLRRLARASPTARCRRWRRSRPAAGRAGRCWSSCTAAASDGQEANANAAFTAALAAQGSRAPGGRLPQRRRVLLLAPPPERGLGALRARRGHPGGGRSASAPTPIAVAIGGISMGGYGAFEIARTRPGRFCAVGGHSAGDCGRARARPRRGRVRRRRGLRPPRRRPPRARARRRPWRKAELWLDGGDADPFRACGSRASRRRSGIRLHASGRAATTAATGSATTATTCASTPGRSRAADRALRRAGGARAPRRDPFRGRSASG